MLTEHRELILKTAIRDLTQTYKPVGSKTVMSQLSMKVSSTTIRNEMAVLEEQGLIEKAHSPNGHIPSSDGYHYYLDHLVEPLRPLESVYNQIVCQLGRPFHQVNEIVQEAAKILSDLTNYTTFAEGPESRHVLITGFRIVPLSNQQVMAILVTDNGNVQSQVYSLPRLTNGEEIEKAVRLINDGLIGKSLSAVSPEILSELVNHQSDGNADDLLGLLADILKDAASEQMYADGQIDLLNSATGNIQDIRSLYGMFDQSDMISSLLSFEGDGPDEHFPVQVKLGSELPSDLLKNYSLLTASHSVGSHGRSTIVLLGPTNMPYSQMIGLMEYFRQELAKKLFDYYGKFQ